jgi:hypothetical protein
MRLLSSAAGAFCAMAMMGVAHAETLHYMATLNAATEVPAKVSAGTGMAMATLDTNTKLFSYTLDYTNLTGPALAAHFHGPADPGVNGPPVVMIPAPVTSPVKGSQVLTDAQIADLNAGKWYVNIHTAANPPGEIRGQVLKTK